MRSAFFFTVLVTAIFAARSAVAAPACHSNDDIHAMQYRQLQVELMVAALKCSSYHGGLHEHYNAYVKAHGPSLKQNAKALRQAFRENATALDHYISEASNEASNRSQYIDSYCEVQEDLFQMVLDKSAQDLFLWVNRFMVVPTSATPCNPSAFAPLNLWPAAKTGIAVSEQQDRRNDSKN